MSNGLAQVGRQSFRVLGVRVDAVQMPEVVIRMGCWIKAREHLVQKLSAEGVRTSTAAERLAETAQLIVALEPVVSNPLGIAVALAADAALLCVTLGETPLASDKRTIEMIGREHFIGCVVVRPSWS